MPTADLPPALWQRLNGRLWHATTRTGLSGIISSGAIKPAIGDRYVCSFCRTHSGICLFDFGDTATSVESQFGNWNEWLGSPHKTEVVLWLDIDREGVLANLWNAEQARQKWDSSAPSKKLIPGVEACHLGPIPLVSITSVVAITSVSHRWSEYEMDDRILLRVDAFEAECPSYRDKIVEALLEGRQRVAKSPKPRCPQ